MVSQSDAAEVVRDGLSDIYPRLWRYAYALSGRRDWAEDLAHATCLRALEKADYFEVGTHLDRWLFRMQQRIWLNEMRARKVRQGGGLVAVEDAGLADTIPTGEANIIARDVLSKVQGLPDAQRETVFLVYIEGYSYKDAADMLEIPIGTVMSRLSAARRKLAALLADARGDVA